MTGQGAPTTELALRRVVDSALQLEDAGLVLVAWSEVALLAGADPLSVTKASSVTRRTLAAWHNSRPVGRHLTLLAPAQ